MKRAVVAIALLAVAALAWRWWSRPTIRAVGPRLISNQTSQPIALYGDHFVDGMVIDGLAATVVDAQHAYLRLPIERLTNAAPSPTFTLQLAGHPITVIDDQRFVDPVALAVTPTHAFVVSTTTDQLFAVDLTTHQVTTSTTCDGPRGLALWHDEPLIACAYSTTLSNGTPSPPGAAAIAVAGDTAFVAGHVTDEVWAIDLPSKTTKWRTSVAPNPSVVLVDGERVFVGSQQFGAVDVLSVSDGRRMARVAPNKRTHILSGRTQKYSAYVMGGKAVRGLLLVGDNLIVSSIGPNVGPNPDRLEVTHDAGLSITDDGLHVVRHVGLGAGVTEGLATNGKHVFAADIASGLVHVFDAHALTTNDADAQHALLSSIPMPGDMFSGPKALAALPDGKLAVLNRFTASLAIVDVAQAKIIEQIALAPTGPHDARRRGEVLYYGDFGRTGMTCDSCHPDGHMDGVFFEKTRPLRIYRATTVRGAAETPPYFIPTSTRSLLSTVDLVGNRNRLHRVPLSAQDLDDLTLFSATVPTLPNPHVGADGAPLVELTLPDGHIGHPRRGAVLFDGKAACASCHPAPLFSLDQDEATRDRHFDVGTPHSFALRRHWQDGQLGEFPPPSLLGVWDAFPLLTTGAAGLSVDADEQLELNSAFALRTALDDFGLGKHGAYDKLTTEERDDLLAYLLSL